LVAWTSDSVGSVLFTSVSVGKYWAPIKSAG
jgi:hypothetical protein